MTRCLLLTLSASSLLILAITGLFSNRPEARRLLHIPFTNEFFLFAVAGLLSNPLYKVACSSSARKRVKATHDTSFLLRMLSVLYRGSRILGGAVVALHVICFGFQTASVVQPSNGARLLRQVFVTRALRKCWQVMVVRARLHAYVPLHPP